MTKKIAIIDADLIGRPKHRFPNLACMKIAGYWKKYAIEHPEEEIEYSLKVRYEESIEAYSDYYKVYISKVFTDTPIEAWLEEYLENHINDKGFYDLPDNIEVGGTGFYFDKAPVLEDDIEHCMPDYELYSEWIETEVDNAKCIQGEAFNEKRFREQFKEYTDYSIGFLTRGCFRKCEFCVNKKYDKVNVHSPLKEFYDPSRKKLCFLDDNFWGCGQKKRNVIFDEIVATGKSFKFKQGMDERLLDEDIAELLFNAKYDGDFTFAFDNISDYDLIHEKLKIIRKHTERKGIMFYVLVGFESTDAKDIENAFKRIELLMRYKCLPYIMRYQSKNDAPWKESPYRALYVTMARWCNQPSIFKKMSFRQFCEANQLRHKTEGTLCSSMKAMISFQNENEHTRQVAEKYFDLRFEDYSIE